MGSRGPAKQPQQLMKLKGTDQPCRARSEVIVGEKITSIEQVDALCDYSYLSPRGQRIFLQRCVFLIGLHVLEASYLDALMLYAQNYDMALRCVRGITKEAWFKPIYNEAGMVVGYAENPYIKRFDNLCKTINSIGTQFGFTPASRARLHVEDENSKKKDIMDISADVIEI